MTYHPMARTYAFEADYWLCKDCVRRVAGDSANVYFIRMGKIFLSSRVN